MNISFFCLAVLLNLKFCQGVLRVDANCVDIQNETPTDVTSSILYLMPAIDESHKLRNERFTIAAHHLGFYVETIQVDPKCTLGNFKALEVTQKLILSMKYNIINLKVYVPFTYLNDYNEESTEGVIFVGYADIGTIEVEVIKCNFTNEEPCSIAQEHLNVSYVKVTSPLKYKILYEIIEHIDDDNYVRKYIIQLKKKRMNVPIQKHSIIICVNNINLYLNLGSENIKYYERECNNVNDFAVHDVLAVIAPGPLENEEKTYLPVIFYDTLYSYLLPNHEVIYPHSITLYGNDNFEKITQHIITILHRKAWSRVAIVSDDSPNSSIFEERLIQLLSNNAMVYTTQRCFGFDCNFTKALTWLHKVDARIIIANVDKNNVIRLAHAAKDTHLSANESVLWIFRECPMNADSECEIEKHESLGGFGELLCLTTLPDDSRRNHIQISKAFGYIKKAFFKKSQAIQQKMFQYSLQRRSRIIINEIKKLQEIPKIYNRKLSITECDSFYGIETLDYVDNSPCSLQRNQNFDSPCEESYLIIIMIVILGVLMLVLIIIMWLKKRNSHLRKYNTFK